MSTDAVHDAGADGASRNEARRAPTEEEFRSWLHTRESARAPVAVVGVVIALLFLVMVVIATLGLLLLFIAVTVASVWFFGRITEARLRGGAVEVSDENFPEIAAQVDEVRTLLGYPRPIRVFVVQDGEFNAALWRVFGRKYLSLNSELVDKSDVAEMTFLIARFVGALRARHLRFHEAAGFVGGLERVWVLNLLILPYVRATVLSGDRIGLMVCHDEPAARSALTKFLIGPGLAHRISTRGVLAQEAELRQSVFRPLSTMWSSHPHLTERFAELTEYARSLPARPAADAPSTPAGPDVWPAPDHA